MCSSQRVTGGDHCAEQSRPRARLRLGTAKAETARLDEAAVADCAALRRGLSSGIIPLPALLQLVLRPIHTNHQVPLHRRKPAPTADMGPGFRRESEKGRQLKHLNGSNTSGANLTLGSGMPSPASPRTGIRGSAPPPAMRARRCKMSEIEPLSRITGEGGASPQGWVGEG